MHLAISVSAERSATFRAMAARSRELRVVDDASKSTALVTDDANAAIAAVSRGKHALVLEPLTLPAAIRTELASSARAMPAHTARFEASIAPVERALRDGKLGVPGLLRIHAWVDPSRARADALARELDLALWMIGSRPITVYGIARPSYVQAHLGFSGGGMALIDVDMALSVGNAYYSLSLIGSTGAAYADDHHDRHLLLGVQGTIALRPTEGDLAIAAVIESFARSVREGREFATDWRDTESAIELERDVRTAANDARVLRVGGRP